MSKSIRRKHYLHPKWIVTILVIIMIGPEVHAQAPEIGLWTGINVEKSFKRRFSLHLNTQVRYGDGLSVRRAVLGELGLSYKLNKRWEVSGYYRYISRRKWDSEVYKYTYQPYHRFYADVSYDRSFWKLKLDYRLRYQNQFKDDADSKVRDKSYVRNKLEISYPNRSRFKPYLSTDLFYEIGTGFDQLRNKAGVSVQIDRRQSVDVFGFSDYQFVAMQENRVNFGMNYRIKF